MKLFCITLFVLVHISLAARLQTSEKPGQRLTPGPAEFFLYGSPVVQKRPVPVLTESAREGAVEELLETDPSIESDPSVLLDPDHPYPDINHFVTPAKVPGKKGLLPTDDPQVAAPPTLGAHLGHAGTEREAFRRKCFSCCKVTKDTLRSWKNSPTRACNVCMLSKNLGPKRSGKCKKGAPLGYYDSPSDCFFDRCHQMLLHRTNSCMCFWDNRSGGRGVLAR